MKKPTLFLSQLLGLCLLSLVSCSVQCSSWLWPFSQEKKTEIQIDSEAIQVEKVTQTLYRGRPSICIQFNFPLDPLKNYDQWIQLHDNHQSKVYGSWIVSEDLMQLYFTHIEPRIEYSLEISQSFQGKNGQPLQQPFYQKIITQNSNPNVGFSERGMIIPTGDNPGLPVRHINVSEVTVNFYKISPSQYFQLLNQKTATDSSYWNINNLSQQLSPTYTGRYQLNSPLNQVTESKIPITHKISEQPGLYLVSMTPTGSQQYQQATTYFSISDIGVHIRQYGKKSAIFTAHIANGKPFTKVHLDFLNRQGQFLNEAETDGSGFISVMTPKDSAMLMARSDKHLALINLQGAAIDISEFDIPKTAYSHRQLFVYGPRDLYRPGEEIHFSILARDFDGEPLPSSFLSIKLLSPDGSVIQQKELSSQDLGYYQYQFELPADAVTGQWQLQTKLYSDPSPQTTRFSVEDFLPERIKIHFAQADQSIFADNEDPVMQLSAQYLYGSPAQGNSMQSRVRARLSNHPFTQFQDYQIGSESSDKPYDQVWQLDDQTLDANGESSIHIPESYRSDWKNIQGPIRLDYRISVLESGGRAVQRNQTFHLWKGKNWPAIKADFNTSDNEMDHKNAQFHIASINAKGIWQAQQHLKLNLVNLNQQGYWDYQENYGWRYRYNDQPFEVWRSQLTTQQQPQTVSMPVENGNYVLKAEDDEGNITSLAFKIGQDWWGYQPMDQNPKPDKINIVLDKPNYASPDIAHVQLQSPRPGFGFVLVESSQGILWSQNVEYTEQPLLIDIPINSTWKRHDIRIVALSNQPQNQAKKGIALRSLGIQALPLNRAQRQLHFSIHAPEKIQPQTLFNIQLQLDADSLKNLNHQPAKVTIAAVDQGVLSVSGFKTPDPFKYFFQQKNTQMDARDNFDEILFLKNIKDAILKYGGDAAELSRGGNKPQSNPLILSLFHQPVTFDQNGSASLQLSPPDFNGAIRLMAVAFSADSFGSTDKEMIIASPIVTQLSLPRFAAFGDITQLSLDIDNTTAVLQKLSLDLQLQGLDFLDQAFQHQAIILTPGQKKTYNFPVKVTAFYDQAEIIMQLKNTEKKPQTDPIDLNRQWHLGLRPAYSAITSKSFTQLSANISLSPSKEWLENTLPESLQYAVHLQQLPPLNTQDNWQYLLSYPYGCLEQISSKAIPLVWADAETRQHWNLKLPRDLNRNREIDRAISHLQSMQRPEGGFGLWNEHSPEEYWLSAYATDFLLTAKDLGFIVPAQMLKKANERLLTYLNNGSINFYDHYSEDPDHSRFAYRSYAAFVLSRTASAPLGSLRQLFDQYHNRAKSPLPLVQLAVALKNQGDSSRAQQALQQASETGRTASIYLADYGSKVRDLAWSLWLNSRYQLNLPNATHLLMDLSEETYRQQYLTTQERSQLFQLSMALSYAPTTEWKTHITTNLGSIERKFQGQFNQRFDGSIVPSVAIKVSSLDSKQLKTYATQTLVAHPESPPKEMSHGLNIQREWFATDGNPITNFAFKTGDLVIVRLQVSANQRTPDALVEELLPAGFELENPHLASSTPLDFFFIQGKSLKGYLSRYQSQVKNQQYLDDRYVSAIDLYPHGSVDLIYLMRATTPGLYQVPSSYVEDMYRPEFRSLSQAINPVTISAVSSMVIHQSTSAEQNDSSLAH